jgi:hypothetical protein
LAAALRAHAKGLYCAEAAVELLIGHAWWLHRDDFVGGFVEVGRGLVGGTVMAWIDWQAAVTTLDAGRLPCCDSEGQILRIAAGIAQGVPIDLRAALTGLDAVNLALVAGAVLHTGGHRGAIAGFARVEGR